MVYILEQLLRFLQGYFSNWTGFIVVLFEYLVTTIQYWLSWVVGNLQLTLSVLFYTPFYIADRVLYLVIHALTSLFNGSVFNAVGLSLDVMKNWLASVIVVAPNAKLLFYILNVDSLKYALTAYFLFLETWCCYRWCRVWIRG